MEALDETRVTMRGWRKDTFFYVNTLEMFDSPSYQGHVEIYRSRAKAGRLICSTVRRDIFFI